MREGFYSNPKYRVERHNRILYVIAGFLSGNMRKGYGSYVEDKMRTYRMNIASHKHYNEPIQYDLLFVDNRSDNNQGIEFMKNNGMYLKRENIGFSFGAWKYAWDTFGDAYDYYLFTEDDHIPCKDNWLTEILQAFLSHRDIGAVGNYLETRQPSSAVEKAFFAGAKNERDVMHNLDGGWTFTSSKVLKEVDSIGGLMVDSLESKSPSYNEVLFQTPMLELGYRIVGISDDDRYFVHGSSFLEPRPETSNPIDKIVPLINCNAIHSHEALKTHFSWYED